MERKTNQHLDQMYDKKDIVVVKLNHPVSCKTVNIITYLAHIGLELVVLRRQGNGFPSRKKSHLRDGTAGRDPFSSQRAVYSLIYLFTST
jgi:hypothetical protein